jgi:hypothetical protein
MQKRSQTSGMSSQAIGAIDAVQPYRGGNDALWRLHKLSIVDKHRLILTAGSAVRSVDLGKYITQMAPKDSPLSLANLSVFLKPRDNDYPLEVGTVVFSDLTTACLLHSNRIRNERAPRKRSRSIERIDCHCPPGSRIRCGKPLSSMAQTAPGRAILPGWTVKDKFSGTIKIMV